MSEATVIESNALAVVATKAGMVQAEADRLLRVFSPFVTRVQEAVDESAKVRVTDATQLTEMREAKASAKRLAGIRIEVEKTRVESKADALLASKVIDGMANVLKGLIEPHETRMEELAKFAERAEAARKAELSAQRSVALAPFVSDLSGYNLGDMKPDDFDSLLAGVKHAAQVKAEQAAKLEAERIAAEQARVEEQKRVNAENERLRAEAVERDAAAKAERERLEAIAAEERAKAKAAQDKADADARAAKAAADKQRIAAEAKAKAEREAAAAKLAEERAAREKLEQEAAERLRVAEQAKADEAERARKAAAAPDKAKLIAFAEQVRALVPPVMSSPSSVPVRQAVVEKVAAFAAWIETQAATL